MNSAEWLVQPEGSTLDCEISRTYRFGNSASEAPIVCTIKVLVRTDQELNHIDTDVRIHLYPFKISTNRPMVMGLITGDLKGGYVEVEAIPDQWRDDVDVALCPHHDDVPKLLRAILSRSTMEFLLMDSLPADQKSFLVSPKLLVKLSLANDTDFKRTYDHQVEIISASQDTTRARHIREGWYRRRSPFN